MKTVIFAKQLLKSLKKQFDFRRNASSFIEGTKFISSFPFFFFTLVDAKILSKVIS